MEEIKPNVVKIHPQHEGVTFFDEEQLKNDEEARELEAAIIAKAKPRQYDSESSILDVSFTIVDDFGNKIPSMHALTTFNEYGVNEFGQTATQVLEEEREAKSAFDEFAMRWLTIEIQMQKLKTDRKALELEFKDMGLDVKAFKAAIKWQHKNAKKTEEEKWYEGVTRQWASGSKAVVDGLERLELAIEETKEVGKDREERHHTLMGNISKRYNLRYDDDAKTGRGHLDNQIEQAAINATFGVHRGEEEFIKLEESKKIREARRNSGYGDLAIHDNNLIPANHREFSKVYGDEYRQRKAEFEEKQREREIFEGRKNPWKDEYEAIDCPLTDDFNELIKHGANQARRLQDCAWIWKQHLDHGGDLPNEEWVERFRKNEVTSEMAIELIKLGAKAEDYLDVKQVCDEMFLSEIDPRRDEWDSPAMKIYRHNRLARTKRIPDTMIEYDPKTEKDLVKLVASGL